MEVYLNDINTDEYSIRDLTTLAPALIDIFAMTYRNDPPELRDPLVYRIFTTALALISEVIGILENTKDQPEITRVSDRIATMRAITKLQKALESITDKVEETNLSGEISVEDLLGGGVNA